MALSMRIARRYLVSGRVHGVGFRYFVTSTARQLMLDGWTRNLADGRVEIVVQGSNNQVETMDSHVAEGPPAARVESVESFAVAVDDSLTGFEVRY